MFRRPVEPPPDPDTIMVGECPTCGNSLQLFRWQAAPPSERNDYKDLWSAECVCGARVYLRGA